MNKVISVIVPVYNVEKYLLRCVDSIINQTYRNLEIILVDDKSTDNSGKMCDELTSKDKRIIVIHKNENQGLGYARNSGIDIATGQYITFIDSDDYIDVTLFENALKRIEESNADSCYYGSKRVIGDEIKNNDMNYLKDEYTGEKIVNDFLVNTIAQADNDSGAPKIGMSAWRMIYDADIIRKNNIRFYSERNYINEDLLFRVAWVKYCKKIVVLRQYGYSYCLNESTLTTSYRNERFDASKKMYDKLLSETEYCFNQEIKTRCQRSFMNNLLVCFRQEVKFKDKKEAKNRILEYCNDSLVKRILNEYPISQLPIQPKILYWAVKECSISLIFLLVKIKG